MQEAEQKFKEYIDARVSALEAEAYNSRVIARQHTERAEAATQQAELVEEVLRRFKALLPAS